MATLESLKEKYHQAFKHSLEVLPVFRGEITWVIERDRLKELMTGLKKDGFDYLVDVSSVDNFGEEPRFEMIYELFSYTTEEHLRVKTKVSEDECSVHTVSDLWAGAEWHEREVFDMMGIQFDSHPDLRRILMWDGYPYFPLRKDFPLEGKETEMPDIAFTKPAPLEGGPFVTAPDTAIAQKREPRAKDFVDRE
ncbi:MAG: NADH-quinone oxidoreductase subunit C [Verrucomicrobiota bacterium]